MAQTSVQINDKGVRLHIIARPSDDLLARAWILLRTEKLDEVVWHAGPMDLQTLLALNHDQDKNCFFVCGIESDQGTMASVAGLAWSCNRRQVGKDQWVSEVGMVFLQEAWVGGMPEEFSNLCLDWGFQNLGLVAVFGTTPVVNHVACLFYRKVGFTVVGTVPFFTTWKGEPAEAQLGYLTKDQWFESRPSTGQEGAV